MKNLDELIAMAESRAVGKSETMLKENILQEYLPKSSKVEKSGKRIHKIQTTLTDEEMENLDIQINASGKTLSKYLRDLVLNGKVQHIETSFVDRQTLDELIALSKKYGEIASLIYKCVIVNRAFSVMSEEKQTALIRFTLELRVQQKRVQEMAEVLYGRIATSCH